MPRFGLCGSLTGAVGYFQTEKRKTVMKKALSLMLAAVLVLCCFAACGGNGLFGDRAGGMGLPSLQSDVAAVFVVSDSVV